MSIHDFYSKLVSESEKSRLFSALRRLSLMPDPKCLNAEQDPSALGGWIPWEGCEEGTCQCAMNA
jgi:hypothetical protein